MSHVLAEYKPETVINFHKDIRFHPRLTSGEKMFYAEIESMTKKGKCPYSTRSLSHVFGVSHTTIFNWVRKLVDLDLLEVGIDYKDKDCRQFLRTKAKK